MRVTGLPAPPVSWITGLQLRLGVRRAGDLAKASGAAGT
jgi:hypothetical protein